MVILGNASGGNSICVNDYYYREEMAELLKETDR
jgi:hypothetical protein